MIGTEYIYCCVNNREKIQTMPGSSQHTRYFKTDKWLKKAVERHNQMYGDMWRVGKFELKEVWYDEHDG